MQSYVVPRGVQLFDQHTSNPPIPSSAEPPPSPSQLFYRPTLPGEPGDRDRQPHCSCLRASSSHQFPLPVYCPNDRIGENDNEHVVAPLGHPCPQLLSRTHGRCGSFIFHPSAQSADSSNRATRKGGALGMVGSNRPMHAVPQLCVRGKLSFGVPAEIQTLSHSCRNPTLSLYVKGCSGPWVRP